MSPRRPHSTSSPPRAASDGTPSPDIGRTLGPYRILEPLGQGGMGQIYLAQRDDAYHQQVAIKILRRGLDGTDLRWRFRQERQILAGLEHPFIARLYDGGTSDEGRPYLVMERIDGHPIDRYCDEHRLTVEQRLRLFAKVCSAVAFAHRNLLVHRDLKPNNILVDDDGVPKLLDFGIAKPLFPITDPLEEMAEQAPLTPGYASPEQILGNSVTTRSDVYSLGILLYRLLCGHTPVRSTRDLLDGNPVPTPSRHFTGQLHADDLERTVRQRRTTVDGLRRRLQGDLDHILLQAMHPQPGERYASAAELARDVERHLDGFPVSARQHRPAYALGKFLQRHRRAAWLFAGFLFIILGGLVSVETARRQAALERQRAQQVQHFLLQTFDLGPDPAAAPSVSAMQLAELALQRLQRQPPEDPEVQVALLDALARMFGELARYDQAHELAGQALAEHRHGQGDDIRTAALLVHLAHLEFRLGRLSSAEMHYREALDLTAAGWWPGRRSRQAAVTAADAVYGLSSIAWDRGEMETSEALLRRTLAERRRLYTAPHRRIAEAASDLSALLLASQRIEEGQALLFEAMEMRRRSLGARHPTMFYSHDHLGLLHHQRGDFEQAEAVYRRTLSEQSELRGPDHPYVRLTRHHLARTLLAAEQLDAAQALMQQNLDIERRQPGDRPSKADTLQFYGRIVHRRGDAAAALPYLQQALEMRQRLDGGAPHRQGFDLFYLARAEADLGRPSALQHLRRAHELLTTNLVAEHPMLIMVQFAIARHLLDLERPGEAEAALQATIEALRGAEAPLQLAYAEAMLGECRAALGQAAAAQGLLHTSYERLRRAVGPDHPWTQYAMEQLDNLERTSQGS